MTNEEAIKVLKELKDCKSECDFMCALYDSRESLCVQNIALDLAIQALEQQRWIPVSEGLPEEDGEYLLFGKITDEDKNCIFTGEYYAWMEKFGIWQERLDIGTRDLSSDFYEYESVIAWCPLPQPYKEEQDGKNNTDND